MRNILYYVSHYLFYNRYLKGDFYETLVQNTACKDNLLYS